MKTRILIATILALSIVVVVVFRSFTLTKIETAPFISGKQEKLTVHISKGTWSFEPSNIDIERGEVFTITIVNDDDITHGFAVDAYGVNETVPPHESRTTRPLQAGQNGTFAFYCSVMCGEGVVATGTNSGSPRGHFDMEGKITVSEPSHSDK